MILTKQQINRYMRHIIMPEISGQGQKKLLETSVLVCGEVVDDISELVYYLAASGVGNIYCSLEKADGCDRLFQNIRDLNEDVSIGLSDKFNNSDNKKSDFRILLGNMYFISRIINYFIDTEKEDMFISTITAVKNQWKGILQTFEKFDELKFASEKLSYKSSLHKLGSNKTQVVNLDGGIITGDILAALCAGEVVKYCLELGEVDRSILYFDIFSMEFSKIEYDKIDDSIEKLTSYNAESNSSITSTGKSLTDCKVLIVGTGGLGSPVALALAKAGIGTIGLVDYDNVEVSNLNRQILHSTSRIGMSKVESAKVFLQSVNPNVKINTYNINFNKYNAMEIVKDYDIVIDGVDNFSTRYLLNDTCFFMKKPMIEAGVIRFSGLNTTIIPEQGHCYRCAFPNIPKAGSAPSCSEVGVLGPVPGVMGFIQAAEAIKIASGKGQILKDKLLFFDAQDMEFTLVELSKNPKCPLCGEEPSIRTLEEHDFVCENSVLNENNS